MTPIKRPDELLHGSNRTDETPHWRHPSKESHEEEAKTTDLQKKDLGGGTGFEVDRNEDEWIGEEILDSFVTLGDLRDGPVRNYVTSPEVEKIMENNIKTAIEVASRRVVKEFDEGHFEIAFTVGHNEQRKELRQP